MVASVVFSFWRDAVGGPARSGHLHVLRWMVELKDGRGPWKRDFRSALEVAATHNCLDVVQWLYERGMDYLKLLNMAKHEHLDVLQWTTKVILSNWDVENGHLDTARWLSKHGYEINSLDLSISEDDRVQVVLEALKNDKQRVAWWMLTRTRFEHEASRQIIRDGIHRASIGTLLWIQKDLMEFEECSWCFTTD
ncbi:hypothetical protein PHMEG_00022237 [Phytophthora megakarya]|uniref:RxLR effector protein n=1 Tax=Phytophthora megakarya TaxID=4795 RepID=A0A225VJA9_9STRA|nr:hypothetical protein PHMEG_00022237 [Phytophthora megakarya]